jgi:ABC-type sugar transport system ATPase subunit
MSFFRLRLRDSLQAQDGTLTWAVADGERLALPGEWSAMLQASSTDEVLLGIRPEHVAVLPQRTEASLPAEVYVSEALGNETLVRLQLGGQELVARADASYAPPIGGKVWIQPDLRHAHLFDVRSEQRIS